MSWIYHLTTQEDWAVAEQMGQYHAHSLAGEGFIHLSTREQLEATANRYFSQNLSIFLLVIAPELLALPVVWEMSPHSESPFPHLYGPLDTAAVVRTLLWARDEDGRFHPPPDL